LLKESAKQVALYCTRPSSDIHIRDVAVFVTCDRKLNSNGRVGVSAGQFSVQF
jgi:hypothetical protein